MPQRRSELSQRWLDGEVLEKEAPGPRDDAEPEPEPSWLQRNRGFIEQGKTLMQTAVIVAPPPARLALAALSVAADGMLLADDLRCGRIDRHRARLRAGGMAVEALTLLAASRLAPAVLARNRARLRKVQDIVAHMERSTGAGR